MSAYLMEMCSAAGAKLSAYVELHFAVQGRQVASSMGMPEREDCLH